MSVRYLVQEFTAKKWWNIRSFDTKAEAEALAKHIGYKSRIKEIKVRG